MQVYKPRLTQYFFLLDGICSSGILCKIMVSNANAEPIPNSDETLPNKVPSDIEPHYHMFHRL